MDALVNLVKYTYIYTYKVFEYLKDRTYRNYPFRVVGMSSDGTRYPKIFVTRIFFRDEEFSA